MGFLSAAHTLSLLPVSMHTISTHFEKPSTGSVMGWVEVGGLSSQSCPLGPASQERGKTWSLE